MLWQINGVKMTDLMQKELDKESKDPLVQEIIVRLATRSNMGIKKYGDTMVTSTKDIIEWIDEAIEENLDAAVYLSKIKKLIKDYRNNV